MLNRVIKAIKDNGLIDSGDSVLCGVSGGADSVVLLHVLLRLSHEMGFTVFAAHFNHMIRGKEADEDELFVRRLCESLGVRLVTGRANVPEYASENGYTLEQAGRILRYEFFESTGAAKIATAHHMDDQAESILMHLIRGSGTSGLCGMRFRRGKLIRPLLCVRRCDIERYASENGLDFCTDKTNLIPDGTRNKLRLNIIPEISREINPRFVEALCAMADIVRRDDDYLNSIAENELLSCSAGENMYNRERLNNADEPIKRRALRLAAVKAGAFADIEQKHIELIEDMLSARTGASLDLPHINVWTSYEKICFSSKEKYVKIADVGDFCAELCFDGETKTPLGAVKCTCVSGNCVLHERYCSYVDADKLPKGVVVRSRRPGDRIHPVGASGTKKLKDFFIDRKVAREKRNVPLICRGSEVLCIIGMTVSESVKVTDNTETMLKIQFKSEG